MSDPLDKEISVSVDLTQTGIKGSAKSRLIAAADRFGGNLLDLMNPLLERRINKQRAIADGEVKLIEAASQGEVQLIQEGVKLAVDRLRYDPAFAERAMVVNVRRVMEKQTNRDAVLLEALEDLRCNPPDETASETGPEQLDEQFMDRLEQYAESASQQDIRQKWGRVLSTEVRAPGTFSLKVLRVVDELDVDAAKTFEALCEMNVAGALPKCLVGELPFPTITKLVMAGLILDPGVGHLRRYIEWKDHNGALFWGMGVHPFGIILFPKTESVPQFSESSANGPVFSQIEDLFSNSQGAPAMPIYLLTDAGKAIATIFPPNDAHTKYFDKLVTVIPKAEFIRQLSVEDVE